MTSENVEMIEKSMDMVVVHESPMSMHLCHKSWLRGNLSQKEPFQLLVVVVAAAKKRRKREL